MRRWVADAGLRTAVEWAMFGCFWTNGQICSATSRVLVHVILFTRLCYLPCCDTCQLVVLASLASESCEFLKELYKMHFRSQASHSARPCTDCALENTGSKALDF
jgi:hypothetical protein